MHSSVLRRVPSHDRLQVPDQQRFKSPDYTVSDLKYHARGSGGYRFHFAHGDMEHLLFCPRSHRASVASCHERGAAGAKQKVVAGVFYKCQLQDSNLRSFEPPPEDGALTNSAKLTLTPKVTYADIKQYIYIVIKMVGVPVVAAARFTTLNANLVAASE